MNILQKILTLSAIASFAPHGILNATFNEAKTTPINNLQDVNIGTEMSKEAMEAFKTIDSINFNRREKAALSGATAKMVATFNKLVDRANQQYNRSLEKDKSIKQLHDENQKIKEQSLKSEEASKELSHKLSQLEKENRVQAQKTADLEASFNQKTVDLESSLTKAKSELAAAQTKGAGTASSSEKNAAIPAERNEAKTEPSTSYRPLNMVMKKESEARAARAENNSSSSSMRYRTRGSM